VLRVRLCDDRGVAGRVDLGHDVDAARGRVRSDLGDVLGRVDLRGRVRALGGELGVPGHDEREGLRVDDVPVKLVHLHERHAVERALEVVDRVVVASSVEHEATVRLREDVSTTIG
jgi:hypothetical protein